MSIDVKICGMVDAASISAAVTGGARYVGFVFFPSSPRAVAAEVAAHLIHHLPAHILSVGLFVNAGDDEIARILRIAPLGMLQLHGRETRERVASIKQFTGLPVIKAVGIGSAADIETARGFDKVADMVLLDAKPQEGQLPGGNAIPFKWELLEDLALAKPWMLAGGLNEGNIAEAIAATKARIVDVSSGVEDSPGHKNTHKIKRFLEKALALETCC
jgi:phosphoribosylanthranilate isomerase